MKKAIFLLVMVFVLFAGLGWPQAVGANEPYSYEVTQQEKDEYYAAIRNCETPSLECLVRYTTRFVAIEWINDIAGQDIDKISGTAPTSSGSNGSAIGSLFGLMTSMYAHPPASSQTYVADLVNNAGFASPAYAQGLGFASLEPILNLWKTFRNVAYFFFILFFIVIGLMIMFRFKIGGQTAVTAQQAIPSVIVSLILVTFSYAIAGFMIDLMYVVMFMIVTIFANTLLVQNSVEIGSLVNMNIFQLAGTLFTASWGALPETSSMISKILEAITSNQSSALSSFVGMIGGITLSLVISIAVLIGVFKLFFELLKSYFIIIVSVVTAPIVLMFGALPGRNVFWPWLKNIVGNLAAFPAVLLVVVLFYQLTNTAGASGGFMPPFLVGSGQAGIVGPIMGLAIILALPEVVKKIKEVFGAGDGGFGAVVGAAAWGSAKQGMPIGLGLSGAALGATAGAVGGLGGGLWQTRGLPFLPALGGVAIGMGRGIGNTIHTGSRLGRGLSGIFGGQTPSGLSPIDNALNTATKHFTDDERLKRLAERTTVLGRPREQARNSYEYRREMAEAQASKRAWEEDRLRAGQYGTPIEKT